MPTIQFKRGSTAQLPDSGAAGEPIFDMEKGQLWIGTGSSRVLINTNEYVLPEVGTPGTYVSVTTDENGRVISGTTTIPSSKVTGLGTAATKNTGTTSGSVPVIESSGKLPTAIIPTDGSKQDKLTFDSTPTSGSTNPVTSEGVATALAGKANTSHSQGHDTIAFNPEANKAEGVFPLDRGYVDSSGACRTAFMPADGIVVEYTQDGGMTWKPYNLTDAQKQALFSMNRGYSVKLGGPSATVQTVGHGVRITVSPTDNRYTLVDMLYCWFSANSATCKCMIERSTIGAKTTFRTIRSDVPVAGNLSPNIISFAAGTFGGNPEHTSNFYSYRFTFVTSAVHTTVTSVPSITDLRLYGERTWRTPNQMMFNGHLYAWDTAQNATFPAQLKASEVYDNNQRVYSPVNKPSATDVTGLGTAATKNTGTTSGTIPLLSTNGKLPETMIPKIAITDVYTVDSAAELITLSGAQVGDVGIVNNTTNPVENNTYILALEPYSTASNWKPMSHPTDAVTSVNGKTGVVVVTKADVELGNVLNVAQIPATEKGAVSGVATLDTNGKLTPTQKPTYTKADVGLGNVDNTSDLNKPLSTATTNALALKANLASPTFTGTPKAPTAAKNTNTTQLATTAYVIGQASTVAPLGWAELGVVGESLLYARADHQHPVPSIIDGGTF